MEVGGQIHQGVLFGNGMECIPCFRILCRLDDITMIVGHPEEDIVTTMTSVALALHPLNKIRYKLPLIEMRNFKRDALDAHILALIQNSAVVRQASVNIVVH